MEWKIKQTERGVGLTCPRCENKLVVNMDEVRATRRQMKLTGLICPYCECSSPLPKEKKVNK